MNTRTKSTSIKQSVKSIVHERDGGCCILCGEPVYESLANAHIVPRSKGGLGIEQNIITLCPDCHRDYDQSPKRKMIRITIETYIKRFYPEWTEEQMIYKKGKQC